MKKPGAYAASETEKEDEKKTTPKVQLKVVASKRGLRRAKAVMREATAYVASIQEAMAKDE